MPPHLLCRWIDNQSICCPSDDNKKFLDFVAVAIYITFETVLRVVPCA